jgi:ribonuclease HI
MNQKNQLGQTGVGVIIPEFKLHIGKKLNEGISVYTAEMIALLGAVEWIEEVRPLRAVICSDSSSSLISLKRNHSESRPDILLVIQQILYHIQMMGLSAVFLWVPAHIGVKGN